MHNRYIIYHRWAISALQNAVVPYTYILLSKYFKASVVDPDYHFKDTELSTVTV